MFTQLSISTPGRICLFGEHQDYLGLPVIAAAISRRVFLTGKRIEKPEVKINMPDIESFEHFSLQMPLQYTKQRDYYKSACNLLHRLGLSFSGGFDVEVRGNIPINSGTSSSSALMATWIHFLSLMADRNPNFTPQTIGQLAYEAEVLEFSEPGGMMDQFSTAIGNVIYLESTPEIRVEQLSPKLGTFVLGDSMQPKDTLGILQRVKHGMLAILEKIKAKQPDFSLANASFEEIEQFKYFLSADEFLLLAGNVSDKDILFEAKTILQAADINHQAFGNLLNRHFDNLRDAKQISTPKLNNMVEAALAHGALGAKTNGSGGGGCMFAYAPYNAQEVAEAIESVGGKSYIINIDEGTRIEP